MVRREVWRFVLVLPFLAWVGLGPLRGASFPEELWPDSTLVAQWEASSAHQGDTLLGLRIQAQIAARIQRSGELETPLPPLPGMKDLLAPDGRLRIITWQHTLPGFRTKFMGVVAYVHHRDLRVVELCDRELPVGEGLVTDEWLGWQMGPKSWLGAGYYAISHFEYDGFPAYLLLGVAGNTLFVQRRVVETLWVNAAGELRFGLPVIRYGGARLSRLMFSHSARVAMTVHLIDDGRRVLLDHLSPSRREFSGLPQYYGPDFSQDELRLNRNGEWIFMPDVVVRGPASIRKASGSSETSAPPKDQEPPHPPSGESRSE